VKLGPSEAGLTVIESGLRLGETVVIDGQFKLRPGARVDVVGPTDKAKTASNP
jgi:multidrug efflux pump subunit AcrA (membrane-fusion protein)